MLRRALWIVALLIPAMGTAQTGTAAKVYSASTNGSTKLVSKVTGQRIYVIGYYFLTSQTTAVTVQLISGTKTTTECDTGTVQLSPPVTIQAPASTGPAGFVFFPSNWTGTRTGINQDLCISTNAAVSVQALVSVDQH